RWTPACRILWLLLLVAPLSLRADVLRRGWVLEELSRPPASTLLNATRSQFSLSAASFGDSVTTTPRALIAPGYGGVTVLGGQRYSGLLDSAEGNYNRQRLWDEMTYAGVELGRYFVDTRNFFGRVSVRVIEFFPSRERAWIPAIYAGTNATPLSPWNVEFSV